MKVKELIKMLSCYPMDAEVIIDCDEDTFREITHLQEERYEPNDTDVILRTRPIPEDIYMKI